MPDYVRNIGTPHGWAIVLTLRVEPNDTITPEAIERQLDAIEAAVTIDLLAGRVDAFNRFITYRLIGANEVLRRLAGGT